MTRENLTRSFLSVPYCLECQMPSNVENKTTFLINLKQNPVGVCSSYPCTKINIRRLNDNYHDDQNCYHYACMLELVLG